MSAGPASPKFSQVYEDKEHGPDLAFKKFICLNYGTAWYAAPQVDRMASGTTRAASCLVNVEHDQRAYEYDEART